MSSTAMLKIKVLLPTPVCPTAYKCRLLSAREMPKGERPPHPSAGRLWYIRPPCSKAKLQSHPTCVVVDEPEAYRRLDLKSDTAHVSELRIVSVPADCARDEYLPTVAGKEKRNGEHGAEKS